MHQPIDDAEGRLGLPEEVSNRCRLVRRLIHPWGGVQVVSRLTIRHPSPGVRYTARRWREWLATTRTVDPHKGGKWLPVYPGWAFECLAEDDSGSKDL